MVEAALEFRSVTPAQEVLLPAHGRPSSTQGPQCHLLGGSMWETGLFMCHMIQRFCFQMKRISKELHQEGAHHVA